MVGLRCLAHSCWNAGRTTGERVQRIIDHATLGNKKGTKSMLALVCWQIWIERNACTFRGKTASERSITEACRLDMEQWRIAGAKCMVRPFGDVP